MKSYYNGVLSVHQKTEQYSCQRKRKDTESELYLYGHYVNIYINYPFYSFRR